MAKKRLISIILAAVLMLGCAITTASAADAKTIHISTADDLLKFAANCRIDSYSEGLTAVLDKDIDLGGTEFAPIPIFSGSFLGSGHTISGLSITSGGSHLGLFRYIQPDGSVADLKVIGKVEPSEGKNFIGGIVGTNRGTVSGCSFEGSISGLTNVGGIAGENLGTVKSCSAFGSISGKNCTGGIVGFSSGSVLMCENKANVNTSITAGSVELESFSLTTLTSAEDSDTVSDTGGIVGNSTGMIVDCTNGGTVGYQHYGYNVGGIAGRQSGYIRDCVNNAQVCGRRDIGGIVGQMEPFMELSISEDIVEELNILHDLIDMTLVDANGQSSNMTDALDRISDNSADAAQSASDMAARVGTVIDGSIGAVNELMERIQYVIDALPPITDNVAVISQNMSEGLLHLDNCFDTIEMDSETLALMHEYVSGIADSMEAIDAELQYFKYLIAVYYNKDLEGDYDLNEMRPDNADELKEKYGYDFSINDKSSDKKIRTALYGVVTDLADDLSKLSRSTSHLIQLLDDYYLEPVYDTDGDGEPDMCRADYASDEGNLARENFKIAAEFLTAVTSQVDALVTHLSTLDEISIPQLGSDYYDASDDLFSSLRDMAGDMGALNASLYQGSDVLTYDFILVNNQFTKVLTMLADALTGGIDVTIIDDISDKELEKSTDGKVSGCRNYGSVDGDYNVGGVTGAMSLEYERDMEGTLAEGLGGTSILSKTYQTKCVLYGCENHASVTAKKDFAGSVAGIGELGTVAYCEGYGPVTSTGGSYVGGIIGSSQSTVIGSSAMCSLSGREYVGGIAGFGKRISECRSLVGISDGTACCGAIAGYIDFDDEDTLVEGNSFVSDHLGAIDGISYSGKAEPVSYEQFLALSDVPDEFTQLTLTFTANGEVLKTMNFSYGGSIDSSAIPQIPEREGYSGRWPDYDYSALYFSDTIDAVYIPDQTTMASELTRDGTPQSLLLVEGNFEDSASLTMAEYTGTAPAIEGTTVLESWVAHVNTTQGGNVQCYSVRYLPPKGSNKNNIDIYLLGADGIWTKVTTSTNGSYVTFDTCGDTTVFSAVESINEHDPLVIGGVIAGGSVLLASGIGITLNLAKKRRSKHAAHASAE